MTRPLLMGIVNANPDSFSDTRRLTTLDAQGVFAIRGASHQVARRLGISRSAFYADLAEARRREEKRSRKMALGR